MKIKKLRWEKEKDFDYTWYYGSLNDKLLYTLAIHNNEWEIHRNVGDFSNGADKSISELKKEIQKEFNELIKSFIES